MREILLVFICCTGNLVFILWAIGLVLAWKSGRGLRGLFSPRSQPDWLSISETLSQYNDDLGFPPG